MSNYNPRPSDKERLRLLLAKLATLNVKPEIDDGWQIWYLKGIDELPCAVSLEEFFVGNPNNCGTFVANLPDHPGEDNIFALCKQIRSREDVDDVLVGVSQIECRDDDEEGWVYSDTLYIVTSAAQSEITSYSVDNDLLTEVTGWFGDIFPDDVSEVDQKKLDGSYGLTSPPEEFKVYRVWWD